MKGYSELKMLAEYATPGPWVAQHPNAGQRGSEVASGGGLNQVCADLGPSNALYIAASNPSAVLALIAEVEGLHAQHGRDSAELRSLCQARDDARKERDQLKAANEQLTEAIGNQTARRFVGDDDQRKIDDLVAAGIREDKRLIGQLKAKIEQQAEEYDKAWRHDLNDKNNVQVLAAEVDALRKDAERYRWLRKQNWFDSDIAVVRSPNESIKIGYDCQSNERLDNYIDNEIKESKS